MILVDTSVWVDHLRQGDPALEQLLEADRVLGHAWVTGELSLGTLHPRHSTIGLLHSLPQARVADESEVLSLVDRWQLHDRGIGYVDVQLLAATRLTADASLWTRDRALAAAASELDCAAEPGA